jgi:hypothetical protein
MGASPFVEVVLGRELVAGGPAVVHVNIEKVKLDATRSCFDEGSVSGKRLHYTAFVWRGGCPADVAASMGAPIVATHERGTDGHGLMP